MLDVVNIVKGQIRGVDVDVKVLCYYSIFKIINDVLSSVMLDVESSHN
jgi:hypothetical protein